MIKTIKLLLFLVIVFLHADGYSQKIARQVLSSQGTTQQLENGQVITQTIGQDGIIGGFNSGAGVQGFQQPLTSKLTVLPEELKSKLVVYPNPFTETLKINVPDVADQTNFLVQLFDSAGGRLLHSQNLVLENATLVLEVGHLFPAAYILKVTSEKINFSSVIFKK